MTAIILPRRRGASAAGARLAGLGGDLAELLLVSGHELAQ
jgi:hypothetical protein